MRLKPHLERLLPEMPEPVAKPVARVGFLQVLYVVSGVWHGTALFHVTLQNRFSYKSTTRSQQKEADLGQPLFR